MYLASFSSCIQVEEASFFQPCSLCVQPRAALLFRHLVAPVFSLVGPVFNQAAPVINPEAPLLFG